MPSPKPMKKYFERKKQSSSHALFMDQVKMVEQEVKQWIWRKAADSDSEYVLNDGVESLMGGNM